MANQSINDFRLTADTAGTIIEELYSSDASINSEEYDIIYAFMSDVIADPTIARNYTLTVFEVARQRGDAPLNVLDQLRNRNQIEVTYALAYYLNLIRSPSTLVGVSSVVTPNFYTARNILP